MPNPETNTLKDLTNRVKRICGTSTSSPIEVARIQIELENEILDLRLVIASKSKERALKYQEKFRKHRWEGDRTMTYNEASGEAKVDLAPVDEEISIAKAYCTYFENLTSIIKTFVNSEYRHG